MHHAHCTISRPPRVRACAELRRRRHLASVLGHPQGLPPPPAAHGARSPPALDHQSRGRVLEARTSNGGSTTGTRPDKIEEKNRRPRGRARHVRGALRSAVKFEIACIRAPGLARGAPSRRAPCGWRCVGSGLSFCVRPKAVGTACPGVKLYFFVCSRASVQLVRRVDGVRGRSDRLRMVWSASQHALARSLYVGPTGSLTMGWMSLCMDRMLQ